MTGSGERGRAEAADPERLEAAAELLAPVLVRTPLVPLTGVADGWTKPEVHQPAGSFKIRGVFHAVARMDPERRAAGLSTVSAGNTAKALAWAGRHFGVGARSLMPDTAPRTKIEAMERLGGTPVLVPMDAVFRFLRERGWEDEPYAFVHPWTDPDLHVGHGTLALEVLRDLPDVDTVYVPVGGGGLLGGVGPALKALRPSVRVVAVEPSGCPSLSAGVAAGEPVTVACDTMCDGVAVPYVTDEMFPVLTSVADEVALVTEDEVRAEIRRLAADAHLVVEGAGALASAALRRTPAAARGRAVALVTGGSIDAEKLAAILLER